MGFIQRLAPGVARAKRLCIFLAASFLWLVSLPSHAAFPATQTNTGECTVAPCYVFSTYTDTYHFMYNTAGGWIYSAWKPSKLAACTDLWGKAPWYMQSMGAPNVASDSGGDSGSCRFGETPRGSFSLDYVAPVAPVYSCPDPTAATLSGSTCTCKANYLQNTDNNGCTPGGEGGTVVDVLHATKVSSCPWCDGNPIYPLVGGKVEPVSTGMSVGGQTLVFTYSSAKQAAAIAAGKTARTFGNMPALGGLWESNLHRNLVMGTGGFGATLYRGNGQTVSFRYSAGAYIADADVNGSFTAVAGGYRYVDAKARTIETYNATGRLTGWADTAGNTLTFSYSTGAGTGIPAAGYLQKITDNNGRVLSFAYTLPAGGVASTDGLISSVSDSAGRTMGVGFDTSGNLTQLTWPDTKIRQFVYENASLPWALTGVVDERGIRYSTFAYDAGGRAVSTEHAGGVQKFSVSYATPPQVAVTQTYDPATQLTTRTHDWQAPVGVQLTKPNGETTNAGISTVLGYPLPAGFSQPAGSGSTASSSASTFDASGNLTSTDDFGGRRTCYAYDGSNRETVRVEGLATTVACSSVLPGSSTLPTGSRRIETSWHADWRLPTKVSEPLLNTSTVYHGQPDPFNSNAVANCTPAPVLPNGKALPVMCKQVVRATTDTDGALGFAAAVDAGIPSRVSSFTYDAAGRMLTSTDPLSRVMTYVYYDDTNLPGNAPADPSMASVSLLLHGDGANGSTTITDSSLSPKSVTVVGGAKISTAQGKFGGSSLFFDGVDASNTALTVADSPDFHFPGAYTIEFWIRPSSFKAVNTWLYLQADQIGTPAPIRIDLTASSGLISVFGSSNNTSWLFTSGLTSTTALPLGTWSHVALADDGVTARLFVNGVLQASRATWPKTDSANLLRIGGAYTGGDREFDGYMDDIRVTKGVARYTASFAPPVQAFPNSVTASVNPNAVGHNAGDLKSVANAAGHVTQFTLYDAAGRVRQMVDPKGVVTDMVYTPRGWTSSVTVTPPGGTARTTTYTYDNAGQMTGATLPDGTTLGYSYDAAHRLTGVTDAKGNTVTYTLDNMGNRTGEQVKDASNTLQRNITRVYDALNRVQQVTGASN